MAQAVCLFDVRVLVEQYRGPLLLPLGPFVGRLEQQVARAGQQLLACIAVWVAVRGIRLAAKPCLLHLVVGLLYRVPTVLDAQLLHGIAGQFLDMETVDDAACLGERRPDNLAHGIRQVERDLLDGVAALLANPLQDGNDILPPLYPRRRQPRTAPAYVPHGWSRTCIAPHWRARTRLLPAAARCCQGTAASCPRVQAVPTA